jgi:hypothetical protein
MGPNNYTKGDMVEYEGMECPVAEANHAVGYTVIVHSGIISLASAIASNRSLAVLNISDAGLNDWRGRRGMDFLGPAVAASNITSLNIAGCQHRSTNCCPQAIGENGGVKRLVELLGKGQLSALDLSSNRIGEKETGEVENGDCSDDETTEPDCAVLEALAKAIEVNVSRQIIAYQCQNA